MRTVAIVATVVALLGISLPFTWVSHAEPEGEPIAAPERRAGAPPTRRRRPGPPTARRASPTPSRPRTSRCPASTASSSRSAPTRARSCCSTSGRPGAGPARPRSPGFVELQQQYKNDLVVVGLSVDDTAEKAKAFADQYKVNYPMVLGLGPRRHPGRLRADLRHSRLVPHQPRRQGLQATSRDCTEGAVRARDQGPAVSRV